MVSLRQFGSIISQAMRTAWDNIGLLMLGNIFWFFVSFFPFLLASVPAWNGPAATLLGALGVIIFIGPATAGVHYLTNRVIAKDYPSIGDFRTGAHRFFGRSLAVVAINLAILVILVFDLLFTINHPSTYIRLLTGIWIYFILFWSVYLQYVFPFLIKQDLGVLLSLKKAALLALDNVAVSLLVALVNFVILLVSLVLAAPIMLFFMGLTAFVQNFAVDELMKKYDSVSSKS